jgi:hypothetical protein
MEGKNEGRNEGERKKGRREGRKLAFLRWDAARNS